MQLTMKLAARSEFRHAGHACREGGRAARADLTSRKLERHRLGRYRPATHASLLALVVLGNAHCNLTVATRLPNHLVAQQSVLGG